MSELKQSSVAILEEAIDRKIKNAQKGRDTTLATVTRVDSDGTTWVRVYGGAEETPVRRMTSSAQVGDTINVVFSGLSCMGVGNVTNPSASVVQVDNVEIAARGAAVAAQAAWAHADDAAVAAQTAWSHADDAAEAAQSAWERADVAADAAEDASRSADSALVQLSIVEDVAGTLDWISKHGSYNLTTDTAVVDGRVYFAYDSSTGDYTPVVSPDPTSNPRTEGWYVLDVADSQSDFIMAHLAVTSRGLWVLPSGIGSAADEQHAAGYKALLSSDGMYVYDSTGALVIKYGQNIEPSTDRPFYIGDPNSTSYILFTPASGSSPSHVSIGGGVSIGSGKTLSELLTAEDITVTQNQTQTGYDVDIAGNTFSLLNGATGPQGNTGPTAQWYYGTALTHTSGTATLATSSTAGVVVGAMYLNTATSLCYKCTAISGTTATWAYAGNLTDGVIDNINVGGRNLIWDTAWTNVAGRWNDWGSPTTREIVEINGHSYLHLITSAAQYQGYSQNPSKRNGYGEISAGDVVMVSFAAYGAASGNTACVGIHWLNSSGSIIKQDWCRQTLTTTRARYVWGPYTAPDNCVGFNVMVGHYDANVQEIWIGDVKLEKGNVATDWTPAPEDLASASTGVYYATCDTAAGTAVKVATTEQSGFSLVPGAMVNVKFTATNSAAVADLKLNVDGTGDKPIKYIYNNSLNNLPGVGYLLANNVYTFRYDGTNWVAQLMYNTDTQSRTRWQNVILAAAAMTNGYVICGTASGYRNVAAGVTFDLSYPLLYCATTKAAGETSDNNFLQINGIKITNNGTVTSAANYKTVYLVGTVSGNTFTVKASPFMTTVEPTSEDGFFYIPLGVFYNSTTNIYFNSTKDLYAYIDGKFRQVTPTEVIAEQHIYCQADSVLNAPTAPSAWITAAGESVSDDEGMRPNLIRNADNIQASDYVLTRATVEDGVIRITPTTSAAYAKAKVDYLDYADFDGATVTASVEARLADVTSDYTGATLSIHIGVQPTSRLSNTISSSYDRYNPAVSFTGITSEWKIFSVSKVIPTDLTTGKAEALVSGSYVTMQATNSASKQPVDVRNFKISRGGAIEGPYWTTKRPTYRTTHPVTFVAVQRKRLDGTVTCTTPLPDDSTTVIDGGHIITGTIDASQVNVINLDAASITSGTIDADRIDVASLEISTSDVLGLKDNIGSIEDAIEDVQEQADDRFGALQDSIDGQADSFSSDISALRSQVESQDSEHDERLTAIETHISFTTIGSGSSTQPAMVMNAEGTETADMEMVLTNTELGFYDHDEKVAWVSNRKMHNTELEVTGQATFGNFAYVPMSDGSLAFKWVG